MAIDSCELSEVLTDELDAFARAKSSVLERPSTNVLIREVLSLERLMLVHCAHYSRHEAASGHVEGHGAPPIDSGRFGFRPLAGIRDSLFPT